MSLSREMHRKKVAKEVVPAKEARLKFGASEELMIAEKVPREALQTFVKT